MKFAFIAPRYGAEISFGADHACRLLAEQVSARHDVDVLTTCAREPGSWKNDYTEGADRVRGALVRRFAVSQAADQSGLTALSRRLQVEPPVRHDELEWVRLQGPSSPGLVDYLKRQHRSYDVLVFFGLMHPLAVQGIEIAPERTVVFPYVRLQPELRFGLWREVLQSAHGIGLFSDAERRLIRGYVGLPPQHDEVVGIGIDPPPMQSYPRHQQDPADVIVAEEDVSGDGALPNADDYLAQRGVPFRRRHRLYGSFALYGGRVEPDNGCEEMLEYFDSYAAVDPEAMLVLMGVKMMKVPEERYLRLAGVLPERERMIAYEAATVTIAPAADDLIAQPLLESLAVGTPVLASARNASAVEHCRRANAGLYYSNRDEFVAALTQLSTNARLRERLGENGRNYIRQHYRWDGVIGRFERLISKVRAR